MQAVGQTRVSARGPMNRLAVLWQSSVGKKVGDGGDRAHPGRLLIAHMSGNLWSSAGPSDQRVRRAPHEHRCELLWIARLVLLAAVILHVDRRVLSSRCGAARRGRSATRERDPQVSTLAVAHDALGRGAASCVFLVFHILHFTTGTVAPGDFVELTIRYHNVVHRFRNPLVVAVLPARDAASASTSTTAHGARSGRLGLSQPSPRPLHRRVAAGARGRRLARLHRDPVAVLLGVIRGVE